MYEAGYSITAVILLAIFSVNLAITTYIIAQTRHSQAKLAWLMVMAILPIIGHIIFLIFGQKYKYRESDAVYKSHPTFSYEDLDQETKVSKANKHLFHEQIMTSKRGVYQGDVQILKSGHDALESLFADLENAKKTIFLHYYIIKPGEIYDHLKSILIKKAKEGVQIKFVIDDFGRWAMPWYEINELKKIGIQVFIYGKVRFPFVGSINGYRTHRKQVIIDSKIVHIGGINIADEYANLNPKYGVWIDYQARITGELVKSHNILFMHDWNSHTQEEWHIKAEDIMPKLKADGKTVGILVEDGPRNIEPIIQDTICRLILNAKKEISIATPYLVPTPEIFAAIRTAAMSGVKINIFVPGKPDKKSVFAATRYYSQRLQNYGVNIYEANNMLIHSKLAVFDDSSAYFGTANLDFRSLYSQFEMIQFVEGDAVNQISDLFEYYKTLATKVKPNEYSLKRINILQRIFVNIFSPLM